jgi:hypothetical protein
LSHAVKLQHPHLVPDRQQLLAALLLLLLLLWDELQLHNVRQPQLREHTQSCTRYCCCC